MDNPNCDVSHGGLACLLGRATKLTVVLVLVGIIAAGVAFAADGAAGLFSVATALAICLVSGLLALFVGEAFEKPQFVMLQLLLSMTLRMGIPLTLCAIIYLRRGPLAEAGMVYYLLVFYFVTLAVETCLTIGGRSSRRNDISDSAKAT